MITRLCISRKPNEPGTLYIDLRHQELRRDGVSVPLPPRQFMLALILVVRYPNAVPFWDFFAAIYSTDEDGGPLHPTESALMVVRALRDRIVKSGLNIVVSSPGRGGGWRIEDLLQKGTTSAGPLQHVDSGGSRAVGNAG